MGEHYNSDFMEAFLGGIKMGVLTAAFLFAFIGIALSLLLSTTKRDPMSQRTPVQFSWNFLWCDNTVRIYKSIATTIIVVFLSLRFVKELIGSELTMFYALGVGLGLDKAIERLKKAKGD